MKRHRVEESAVAVAIAAPGTPGGASPSLTVPTSGLDLAALERAVIAFALESHAGNQVRSARFLGISRSALIYRMRKHRLNAGIRRGTSPRRQGASRTTGHEE
jgi:DNA-binding NtrC family response regulator